MWLEIGAPNDLSATALSYFSFVLSRVLSGVFLPITGCKQFHITCVTTILPLCDLGETEVHSDLPPPVFSSSIHFFLPILPT